MKQWQSFGAQADSRSTKYEQVHSLFFLPKHDSAPDYMDML